MKSYQVTLTDANTNYNLLTLVRAIDTGFVDQGKMSIQAAGANAAAVVLIGDASLSATRYGAELGASDAAGVTSLGGVYARSAGAGTKLNINVVR